MPVNQRQPDPVGIVEGYSPSTHYAPNFEEQKLIGEIQSRFNEAKRARQKWEDDANFFFTYLRGDQITLRNPVTNEVFRASFNYDTRKLPSIDNVCRVAERALVGKLTKIIPRATVIPASEDADDMRAAQTADTLLEFLYRKEKMRIKYLRACKQLAWAGTAIFQISWDTTAGDIMSQCPQCEYPGGPEHIGVECPRCALDAQAQSLAMQQMQPDVPPQQPAQAPIMEETKQGDVRVDILDPRDFYPEPGATTIEEMRWAIVYRPVPVSALRWMFPDKAQFITEEAGIYSSKGGNYFGNSRTSADTIIQDHAYLYECHEKPTLLYPKGRTIWMTGSVLLRQIESTTWMLNRLPFFSFWYWKDEGEFWGQSPMSSAWHIQKERNKLLSQLRTQREMTNHRQKLVPMQSQITSSEWDDTPGRIISYNPMGGKPEYLQVPEFPSYVYAELNRLRNAIQEKFAVTDQEMGGQVTGDPSGRYAAILEAQSSESIAPVIVENNAEWLDLNRAMLQLAQQYYQEEKTWAVTGHDRVKTSAIKQMNLSPGWDVELAEEDSLSNNPALRLQQAQNLLQSGVFQGSDGTPDMRAFKRAAGLRLPGVGADLAGNEHAYAASIPDRIARGEPIAVRPWDDAKIMAEELMAWLRGPGRSAPEPLVAQVGQLWTVYASAIQPMTAGDAELLPNSAQQPQAPAAPAGPAMNQNPSQAAQANPAPEVGQVISQADKAAEAASRMQAAHEG
jgi:hypothetical protein